MTLTFATPVCTTATLASDPTDRYRTAVLFGGLWITLISGDFAIEGRLIDISRPDFSAEDPSPMVTIDTGRARVKGPLLAGDILAG